MRKRKQRSQKGRRQENKGKREKIVIRRENERRYTFVCKDTFGVVVAHTWQYHSSNFIVVCFLKTKRCLFAQCLSSISSIFYSMHICHPPFTLFLRILLSRPFLFCCSSFSLLPFFTFH